MRREAHFVESGIKAYHNVKKYIGLLLKYHAKAKYRYFIVKELKTTEITYIEQLTRMTNIKSELLKIANKKIVTEDEVEGMMPRAKELLSIHHKVLDQLNLWTPK